VNIQYHNLGYLRMAVENAMVAHLTAYVDASLGATVRPAYSATEIVHPLVTVHATRTRERNEDDYSLARYLDVEVRCVSYAEATDLLTAREAHYRLVADVYHALANADIVAALNATGEARVEFWSCYAKTDEGSIAGSSYVTTISVEVGATPKED
jgi:hypothetical protein